MYNPVVGGWLSRDPLATRNGGPDVLYSEELVARRLREIWPTVGENAYEYANSNPMNRHDPSGLKTITIDFVHLFRHRRTNSLLPQIKAEVERIYETCFDSCVERDESGEPLHTLQFQWTPATDAGDFEARREDFGWVGGRPGGTSAFRDIPSLGGPHPGVCAINLLVNAWKRSGRCTATGFQLGLRDSLRAPTFGQTGSTSFNMNIDWLITFCEDGGHDLATCIATTIAHESGLHIIAGIGGHPYGDGFVDSAAGKVGGEFSPELCDRLCELFCVDGGGKWFP